jgi:hypothetical protein
MASRERRGAGCCGLATALEQAIGTAELDYGDVVTCLMAGGGRYADPVCGRD